ncbi:MAG: hypothetical protein OHK0039_15870 [Bacteroidia bacterium]
MKSGAPLLIAALLLLAACAEPCDDSLNPRLGEEFFTVQYNNTGGANYLDGTYNPNGIVVFVDESGGTDPNPRYELLSPGYSNGKFGPFSFTENFYNAATDEVNVELLIGKTFRYDYYIKKDTYGVDTFTVAFLLDANTCNYYWRSIQYYRNGDLLPQYNNQRQVEMVFVE